MNPKTRNSLGAALMVAFSVPALGAGDTTLPGKGLKTGAGEPKGVAADSVFARPGDPRFRELTGQVVYQVLIAEVALQRGRHEFASQAYADLATRTRDPAVLERAIEVAGYTRRFDLVLELARLWIGIEPESKRAQQVLAGVMIMTNQFDGLAPQLISMLEADKPALPANLLGLNRMFARSTDRPAVLQVISKVCAPFFGIAEAHYAVAVAASSAGEQERALGEARQALELRPDWEAGALLEAQLLARRSSAEAITSLQRFVDRYAEAREVRLHLARLLVGEKRYAEAKRHFEQLLVTYPNNPDVVFPVAILALQEDDRALAEAQLRHLVTLDIPDKSAPYYYLGQLSEESRRGDEALSYYRQVGPGEHFLPAQLRSATLLVKQNKMAEARSQIHEAMLKSPQQRIPLAIGEATMLRDAKMTEEALTVLEQELLEQPEQPDLLYESSLLAEKLDRLELMESRLRKLIDLQPENAQAYNALGYSYADRKMRLPEARQLIEKALQLAPDDPFILDSMGWVLYRQGDLEAALNHLQRAHTQRADPEIAAHLAEVLWTLGRQDEAGRTLRDAQKRQPNNEVLTETAKRLSR